MSGVAHLGERVEGFALGSAHVGGRQDAHRSLAHLQVFFEFVSQHAHAVPTDERAQKVDAVGRLDLALDGVADPRLVLGVDQ